MASAATDPLPTTAIPLPLEEIQQFCRRWEVSEFALFGSVLRSDFVPASDVDVMVSFSPSAHPTLYSLVDIRDELEALFGRNVDLLTRRGVEAGANAVRRRAILQSARVVYAL